MTTIIHSDDFQLGMGLAEIPAGREESPGAEGQGGGAAGECQSAVRLRRPERRQMAMVVQCPDDLVSATHPVRRVAEVVEHLEVSGFCQPIKAREGVRSGMEKGKGGVGDESLGFSTEILQTTPICC